ncbi:amidohydrolase [Virgibacillus natechei]|uniref:Peptidase M20 domain-containing protein 2 n=1 Tax=Virgibacillus natechei TaxID=1216297 RepID=A0ABS4ILA6_9BACI|nr:M20 family metallopeptidase [Virgibacillus natechei]MBP1971076.1 amidohydrolase [Virgibacillus natechei]UZD13019.1 M20 family metallopeptidase [Virgibacillus natechei]
MTVVTTNSLETVKKSILDNIEENKQRYIQTSHDIHDNPEIGNEEHFASTYLTSILEDEGFHIEKGVAGHETAFLAKKKGQKDGRTIGFLAEYDALPEIGHACGHNIIGTTSVAAAVALSKVIDEVGGELVVLGTPAEEGGPNGSAKGSFVKAGLVEGIDAAIMLHPGAETNLTGPTLAVDPLDFEFFGKPAHASAHPEKGINALDGVLQLFNGINALRQHLPSDVRIHGIITDGGDAPNIVPEYAKARFFIRAASRTVLNDVTKKVKAIAEGAGLSTGATVHVSAFQNEVDNFILNNSFDQVFKGVIEDLGETVDTAEREALGSTDAGNISQVVPTIHPHIKIGSSDLIGHTVEFREAARSQQGDQALILGAKAAALTMLEVLTNKATFGEIHQEFVDRSKG